MTGRYRTTINELTDQFPALRPQVLAEAVHRLLTLGSFANATKLVVEEDKGAVLAGPMCLATGLPLAVARWYPYELPADAGEPPVRVPVTSEYFSGHLYLNGIVPGDKVVIIDDTLSTGGTLAALVSAVNHAGGDVLDALVVTEKVAGGGARMLRTRCGIEVKSVIRIEIDAGTRRVRVLPPLERDATSKKEAAMTTGTDIISAIGGTELCELRHVTSPGSARVLAKCEFRNPTGSHKDRIFNYMINELERRCEIAPGWTLVESSTGNGGAALAQVGLARGYRVVIIMPAGMTIERKTQIQALGAEIIETDPDGFLIAAEEAAHDYTKRHPRSYFLDQSSNPLNWQAWRACGAEIASTLKGLGRPPDRFVCSIGTGGTFSGIADVLKATFPGVTTVAVEVDSSAPLHAKRTGTPFEHRPHNLIGLGPGKIAANVHEHLIDEVRTVSGADAWAMMKRLIEQEKLFAGPTAGANAHVAAEVAAEVGPGGTIVTVLFDSAWKYVSVWDGDYSRRSHGPESHGGAAPGAAGNRAAGNGAAGNGATGNGAAGNGAAGNRAAEKPAER